MTTTRIEILRHGIPEGEGCFRGHTDFKLTPKGLEQMQTSMTNCETPDIIVTSPLRRCSDFANQYAEKYNLPVIIAPEFMEIHFGDWDGKPTKDIWEKQQQTLSLFWSKPWQTTPPNGESLTEFDQRISTAWQEMINQHQGKHILLVCHEGVIKQIVRGLLDIPKTAAYLQRLTFPYASRVSVSVYHDENGQMWPELIWPCSENK